MSHFQSAETGKLLLQLQDRSEKRLISDKAVTFQVQDEHRVGLDSEGVKENA